MGLRVQLRRRRSHVGVVAACAGFLIAGLLALWTNVAPAYQSMNVMEAFKLLGLEPGASRNELKSAFRKRCKEVHPDVTGDDGKLLNQMQEALKVAESLTDPEQFIDLDDPGLPTWAQSLLHGIKWSDECPSYSAFLQKPDCKALAVGEYSMSQDQRPWAAIWGRYSQEDANAEALRVCRLYGGKCRLIYIGNGKRQRASTSSPTAVDETDFWDTSVNGQGRAPTFGWMPKIDPDKEKLIGYKTIRVTATEGYVNRIRIPVLQLKLGGLPYYYSPTRPRERIYMKSRRFKHTKRLTMKRIKADPRYQEMQEALHETPLTWSQPL